MQNLVDNAIRFEKESLGPGGGSNLQIQKNIDWTTEMKIKLVKIDDEERSKGRGKRVKERWDLEFPKQVSVSMYNLRINASRFQKEPEKRNLISVRNRNEIDRQKNMVYEDPINYQTAF